MDMGKVFKIERADTPYFVVFYVYYDSGFIEVMSTLR